MEATDHSQNLAARIWKLLFPIRWPLSKALWVVSRIVQAVSVALWGIHVAIDYLRLMYLDYTPRPDDIFIVAYPRSGTTWMQMIMYQLTTDGNMDFVHIADVCPWFERAALNGRDFEALPSPRVFKSHLPHIWMPWRAPRSIYVARNGKDVASSFYHFLKSHFRYRGTFPKFFKLFMRGWLPWGSWFYHVSGWWRHRDDHRVLFLQYEDLVADLEGCVRQIIRFCGLTVPEERMPEILDRCSFAFMKQFEDKFDFATEHMLEQGYTPSSFLRQGKTGDGKTCLSAEEAARFDRKFERRLGKLGVTFDSH